MYIVAKSRSFFRHDFIILLSFYLNWGLYDLQGWRLTNLFSLIKPVRLAVTLGSYLSVPPRVPPQGPTLGSWVPGPTLGSWVPLFRYTSKKDFWKLHSSFCSCCTDITDLFISIHLSPKYKISHDFSTKLIFHHFYNLVILPYW